MIRIFKLRWFHRFAVRERLTDAALRIAVRRIDQGQADANLGGGIYKQRIARASQGKSRGYRSIVAYRSKRIAVFLYGFSKSERANVKDDEVHHFREIAKSMLALSDEQIQVLVDSGDFVEILQDAADES